MITREFFQSFVPLFHSTILHQSKQMRMNCPSFPGELVARREVLQSVEYYREQREPDSRFCGKGVSDNMIVRLNSGRNVGIVVHHFNMEVSVDIQVDGVGRQDPAEIVSIATWTPCAEPSARKGPAVPVAQSA